MTEGLRGLSDGALTVLAAALRSGRLRPPFSAGAVTHLVGGGAVLAMELNVLAARGLSPDAVSWGLDLLADERAAARRRWEGVSLTWTGPEEVMTETRDTGAVARSLFAAARRSLLVSTYALDEGAKGENLLAVLRDRMSALPELDVRFYLNLGRSYGDDRPATILLAEHAQRLAERVFTWEPTPRVFYDRRALEPGPGPRACLHAKVIVCDEEQTLLSSANLTEAAQERNIEAGVLIEDASFARGVLAQFKRLVAAGVLVPLQSRVGR